MTENEKRSEDLLRVFPPRTREILRLLCRRSLRGEIQELVWTIEARAAGQLPHQGDAVVTRLIPLSQIPEIHHAEKFSIQPQSGELESPDL